MKGAEEDVGRLEGSRGTIQVTMCAKVGDQKRLDIVATLSLSSKERFARTINGRCTLKEFEPKVYRF